MTYIVSGFFWAVNFGFAHSKKNTKIIAFFLLGIMWILFWGNIENPDYSFYALDYYLSDVGDIEPFDVFGEYGFVVLMRISNYIGLSYNHFLAIISGFSFLLINSTIKLFTKNFSYFYSLYFLYPFFMDVIQVRNFLAVAILIFSVRYLIKDTKVDRIKFLLCVFAMISVHRIGILYLPLILTSYLRNKKIIIYYIVFSAVVFSLFILANNENIPYLGNVFSSFLAKYSKSGYLNTKTNFGFLIHWFEQSISFIMIMISRKYFRDFLVNTNNDYIINENNFRKSNIIKVGLLIDTIYIINLLAFVFLPLYTINSNFGRILRNILPLNYLTFAVVNDFLTDKTKRFLFNLLVLFYIFSFLFLWLYGSSNRMILQNIMEHNLVF